MLQKQLIAAFFRCFAAHRRIIRQLHSQCTHPTGYLNSNLNQINILLLDRTGVRGLF